LIRNINLPRRNVEEGAFFEEGVPPMFQPIRCRNARKLLVVLAVTVFFSFYGEASAQTILADIPISYGRAGTTAVNPATNRIYVATGWQSDQPLQIVVIDGATNTPITSIDTSAPVAKITVNSTTNRIYALVGGDQSGNRVMVIDGATNQIINVFDVDKHTGDIAVNPITNRLYAMRSFSISTSPYVAQFQTIVMDGSTGNVIGSTPLIYGSGKRIAVNPTTNRVYVLNGDGHDVLIVFNGETNALETTISDAELGLWGGSLAVNPVTNQIYVLGLPVYSPIYNSAVVAVVDGNTHAHVASLAVGNTRGAGSFAVNSTTNRIYVIHGNYYDQQGNHYDIVTEFDGGTHSIVSKMTFYDAGTGYGIAVNAQTNRLFINRGWNFLVIDPVDITPPILATFDLTSEATSVAGAMVYYPQFATDNSNVAPALQCSIPSGSGFPIGTTSVTCLAVDFSGNTSAPQNFLVNVIDAPPVLSLPDTIFTDQTNSSGATVSYIASANDIVSGDLPINCNPASGNTFEVGGTTVNCTATDSAGNTSSGSFQVFILAAGQAGTPTGDYVTIQNDSGLSLTFDYVQTPGITTVTPLDPATVGDTPSGFAVSNVLAYEIHTTADFAGQAVTLSFVVPGTVTLTEDEFNSLTVLHNENGQLVELYSPGRDYSTRTIYAVTYSFSPFFLAKKVDKKIAPLFDRATAYKSGSTIPVKLKVLSASSNANLSSSSTVLTARSLKLLGGNTSLNVADSGNSNPDDNFRYLNGPDGGSYIFNLSTRGLQAGSYALSFYVGNDRSFFYTVKFEVK
jgi:DNA-binding beta-propeller fold protein YncE